MSLRASASACEISPGLPIPLSGFAGTKRVSTAIKQPLFASAVHIRGGSGGCIIISLDLFSIDPQTAAAIREQVYAATGTPRENIFITTTGCHSSPYTEDAVYLRGDPSFAATDPAYLEQVIQKSVQAASESAVSTRPASVAVVTFDAPGTGALLVKGDNGRVIATVIVRDDIPDYMGRENADISADMVGTLRDTLKRRFGSDAVTLFISAPCGEQLMQQRADYGEASAQAAGKKLSEDLLARIMTLRTSDFSSDFAVAGGIIDLPCLPFRSLPHIFEAAACVTVAKQAVALADHGQDPDQCADARWSLIEANHAMSLAVAAKEGVLEATLRAYGPAVVQRLRVGPITIIGVPCYLSRHAARKIISQNVPGVWLAQCVNGTMLGSMLSCQDALHGTGFLLRGPAFEASVADDLTGAIMHASASCTMV
ncbi:MAG: hypothetical protein ACNA71_00845 [Kiritimatiellia bacterium]